MGGCEKNNRENEEGGVRWEGREEDWEDVKGITGKMGKGGVR